MDVYNKIGFKDRIDTKPSSYLVDGETKTIEKDNSGVKQEGSNLNAENLNHMDNGIFQNSQNIKTLNDTITKQGDSIGDLTTQYEDNTKKLKNFGSRNYILNSGDFTNLNNWKTHGNVKVITRTLNNNFSKEQCKNVGAIEIAGDIEPKDHYLEQTIELEPKTTYTFTIYSDAGISDASSKHNWNLTIKDSSKELMGRIDFQNGFNRKSFTFTTTDKRLYTLNFGGFYITGGKINVFNLKLEKGYLATDWNLAPEEVIANSKRLDTIEKILIDKGYMKVTQKL